MGRPALSLVESTRFTEERGTLWPCGKEYHSLHDAVTTRESSSPHLANYFIRRYSEPHSVILDPFCGRGTTPLAAALSGRIPYAFDAHPLFVAVTQAKLQPIDIAEVTLFLQRLNLELPVSLDRFEEPLRPFYDFQTFRELFNLRRALGGDSSRAARFIEPVALSILHGHTAGFLSVYSFPQFSLQPSAQRELNDRRNQSPEYRAVQPRLLRKAALLLRDGSLSVLSAMEGRTRVGQCDARDLKDVRSSSVDLVVTSPPRPGQSAVVSQDQWLELWFAGVRPEEIRAAQRLSGGGVSPDESAGGSDEVESWLQFMNESVLELARVVKSGGRAALEVRDPLGRSQLSGGVAHRCLSMIQTELSRFWTPEGLFTHESPSVKLGESGDGMQKGRSGSEIRVILLKRR